MKNKEEVLNILYTGYAALRATTTVDTFKSYIEKSTVLEDDDIQESQLSGQVTVVRQRQEMELIRVKNEEEIRHIANLKTARVDQLEKQLEIQQKLNFEDLIQQDALQERRRFEHEADLQRRDDLQKRLRVEREENLEYEQKRNQMQLEMERAKLGLEHDRRMFLDPSYKSNFLEMDRLAQLPVATVLSIVPSDSVLSDESATHVEQRKLKKPRKYKKAEKDPEVLQQAAATRSIKAATTRRERAEALKEKKRLEYLALHVTDSSLNAIKARYEDLMLRAGVSLPGSTP